MNSLKIKSDLTPHYIKTEELTFNKKVKKRVSELLLKGQKIVKVRTINTYGTKSWLLKNQFGINIIHINKDPMEGLVITYWR